jgi:hypothetical protein
MTRAAPPAAAERAHPPAKPAALPSAGDSELVRYAIWLYARFTLSYRDVEDLLAERGFDVSYETVRRWVLKFGPAFARNLRRLRPRPADTWHLDELSRSGAGACTCGEPSTARAGIVTSPTPRPGRSRRWRALSAASVHAGPE